MKKEKHLGLIGVIFVMSGIYLFFKPIAGYESISQFLGLIFAGLGIYWGIKYG